MNNSLFTEVCLCYPFQRVSSRHSFHYLYDSIMVRREASEVCAAAVSNLF